MLTSKCIHPEIMHALSLCGHGSKILIADGNYPLATKCNSNFKVYLGLTASIPTVPQVLEVICSVVNIEKAEVMVPEAGSDPEVFSEFHAILTELELVFLGRNDFYKECSDNPSLVLAISTGEKRTFSNILLTVGCA